MNWQEHVKNRNAFPFEQLQKYERQHVAWSLDGNCILDGDKDPTELIAKLDRAGYKSDDYVLSYVDFDNYLGGVMIGDEDGERKP
jgi:hypothetical protein